MLAFLEVAEFRDFIAYLSFSLCRLESLQLGFQVLVSTTTLLKTQGPILPSGFQPSAQEQPA